MSPVAQAVDLTIVAWSVFLLGIALVVGLSNKRRPSILVDVFILALVGAYVAQIAFVDDFILLSLSFIPMRYAAEFVPPWAPGGFAAYLWTPVTHALLHGDGSHIFFNGVALFIFGRAVAWRFGGLGFLSIFALSAAAGALAHMTFNWGSSTPLIGASGGAFGVMGATFRFVPKVKDQLKALFWPDNSLRTTHLSSIRELVTQRRSLLYILLCIIIYPLGLIALLAGTSGNVAVMAHVGGLAFGVFGVSYFDRRRPAPQPELQPETVPGTKHEHPGIRVLRVVAVIMMIVGIGLGVIGYYLPLLGFGG